MSERRLFLQQAGYLISGWGLALLNGCALGGDRAAELSSLSFVMNLESSAFASVKLAMGALSTPWRPPLRL